MELLNYFYEPAIKEKINEEELIKIVIQTCDSLIWKYNYPRVIESYYSGKTGPELCNIFIYDFISLEHIDRDDTITNLFNELMTSNNHHHHILYYMGYDTILEIIKKIKDDNIIIEYLIIIMYYILYE